MPQSLPILQVALTSLPLFVTSFVSAVPSVLKSGRPSTQPSESPSTPLPTQRPLQSLSSPSLAPAYIPTTSPTLSLAGACPEEYIPLSRYSVGTQVQLDGIVFECVDIACGFASFKPEPSLQDGLWRQVWDVIGTCSGTFAPATSSPTARPVSLAPMSLPTTPPSLSFAGACPNEYRPLSRYSIGTQVQLDGIVFECVDIACGYDGFEPEPSLQDGLWRQVWDVIGTCNGTIAPTTSIPTAAPSVALSENPSQIPSLASSFQPSEVESEVPSDMPSKLPTTNNPTSRLTYRVSDSFRVMTLNHQTHTCSHLINAAFFQPNQQSIERGM